MTPYYADDWLTVYLGDCRAVLAEMPADSVHCVITSPPYYGLRDYGTAEWEGGDEGCDHKNQNYTRGVAQFGSQELRESHATPMGAICRRCGARRIDSQIGLEPTPEQYVAELVAVFREVWRVLRPDGTVWLNLGDSYAGSGPMGTGGGHGPNAGVYRQKGRDDQQRMGSVAGLKPKDRMMIPARVALALQADGWWLRDEIVWAKPNPMPSSVTDRTTPAHEMVYLLTKRARYWYDADAVREPHAESTLTRIEYGLTHRHPADAGVGIPPVDTERMGERFANPAGRNKRSVWTIATQPYPEAHFATFPEALVEPMILAGCPEGGVVLDPFAGSGTVGLVAQRHSRRAILVDLSAEYMKQLMDRNQQVPFGFAIDALREGAG